MTTAVTGWRDGDGPADPVPAPRGGLGWPPPAPLGTGPAGVGLGVGSVVGEPPAFGVGFGVGFGFAVGFGVGFGVALGVGFGVGLGVGLGVGSGVGFGVGFGVGLGVGAMTVIELGLTVSSVTTRKPLPFPEVARNRYAQTPAGSWREAVKTTPALKSVPVVVMVVFPTPAIMTITDDGAQPAESA
jgi:hypothetical protein